MAPRKTPRLQTTTVLTRRYESDDNESNQVDDMFDQARIKQVKFDEIMDMHTHSMECWGCVYQFGKQQQRNKNKALDALHDVYEENKDSVSEKALATLLHKVHEKEYRINEIMLGNLDALEWPVETIMSHLRYHMFDLKRNLKQSIRDLTYVETKLRDCLFTQASDDTSTFTPDKDNLKLYTDIIGKKSKLMETAYSFSSH